MNLTDFQIAVLGDDTNEVHSLLLDIDRRTERDRYREAARQFGFDLLEHRGKCYAMRRELASVFGYSGESGLRMLCEKYDVEGVSIATFAPEVRMWAQENLGLHSRDGKTIFLSWDGFLLAGARGDSEAARKVFAYLLKMERAGRIAGGAMDAAKANEARLKQAERVVNIAAKFGKVPQPLQQKIGEYLDNILDITLGQSGQLTLFSNKEDK
ncbi:MULTISPECIES: hypothetical protein [Spongiibacter]|uniref:hypothetical protein n=1 Tax=Spongiibacter TaxID=630749 RepID=UPI00195FB945|nr:hypothetical protein [Spongiibacter marinus]MBM7423834.1 hypothetical protein [Spongiibacter marinus]